MNTTPRAPIDARLRGWGYGVLLLLSLAIAVTFAWHRIFSASFAHDEGYLMVTIQSFVEGNALYDTVFTQYGPFYYAYEGIVRGLGLPLTHDATRLLCILHWLATAAVLGLAGGLMMRSIFAGVFVFMQVTAHLTGLAHEPRPPQEIITLLLGIGLLVAAVDGSPAQRFERLAVVAAMLTLIKINVGVLFGLALFLILRHEARDRFSRAPWTWLLMTTCASLPFLLMRRHLSAEWCRNYAIMAASTILSAVLVANRQARAGPAGQISYPRILAFFAVPCALFLGVAMLTGTSFHGLLNGLVLTPLKTPTIALLPVPLFGSVLINAVLALAAATLCMLRPDWLKAPKVVPVLQGACGLTGALWLTGKVEPQLAYLLPWVWLVLLGPVEATGARPPTSQARRFLCLVAAWQGLQAYPIAGTQITVATLPLVLVYALCLHDALQAVMGHARGCFSRGGLATPQTIRLALVLAATALLYLFANVWCALPALRRHYASLTPLNLRGANLVRLDPETVAIYRELSAYLEAGCDTFITYPGYHSLYFWSDKRPPTHLNSNGWGLLTLTQQNHILAAVRQARRPMIVVWASVAENWKQYIPPPISPVGRFVLEECHEVKRIGPFSVFALRRGEQR